MSDFDIQKSFHEVGLKENDIVMIHGNGGVAAQYNQIPMDKRLNYLIDQIKDYFSLGTVLVPAFSYSFTKNEDFDANITPSEVGLFSECFRSGSDIIRTNHPIFSVSAWGKSSQDFIDGVNTDCFGPNTFFEKIHKYNVKLVALGCDFSTLTFAHYVEQKKNVSYRYFKNFPGNIIAGDNKTKVNTSYYVRDINLNSGANLKILNELALKNNLLLKASAGRFPIQVINSSNFFSLAMELLSKDEYSLINEGVITNEI
tara:strand:- start:10822 stop:11592 length:771 start_codon:yes stop_codon:yes gene_type:complete